MKNYYSVFLFLSGSFCFINASLIEVCHTRDNREKITLRGSDNGFDILVIRYEPNNQEKNSNPYYELSITNKETGKTSYLNSTQYNPATGNVHAQPKYYFNLLAESSVLFKLYALHRKRNMGFNKI